MCNDGLPSVILDCAVLRYINSPVPRCGVMLRGAIWCYAFACCARYYMAIRCDDSPCILMNCVVLCCVVVCCAVLYCVAGIVLRCVGLCCAVSCCVVLCCVI